MKMKYPNKPKKVKPSIELMFVNDESLIFDERLELIRQYAQWLQGGRKGEYHIAIGQDNRTFFIRR